MIKNYVNEAAGTAQINKKLKDLEDQVTELKTKDAGHLTRFNGLVERFNSLQFKFENSIPGVTPNPSVVNEIPKTSDKDRWNKDKKKQ